MDIHVSQGRLSLSLLSSNSSAPDWKPYWPRYQKWQAELNTIKRKSLDRCYLDCSMRRSSAKGLFAFLLNNFREGRNNFKTWWKILFFTIVWWNSGHWLKLFTIKLKRCLPKIYNTCFSRDGEWNVVKQLQNCHVYLPPKYSSKRENHWC